MLTHAVAVPTPFDLRNTLRVPRDPGWVRLEGDGVWCAEETPDGAVTLRLDHVGGEVRADAWGPGAAWALERLGELLGLDDDPDAFPTPDPRVAELHRRFRGVRLGRTSRVVAATLRAICGQRVTWQDAGAAWRGLCRHFGEPAPGPVPPGVHVSPTAAAIRALPLSAFHLAGIELRRAEAMRRVALAAHRLESGTTAEITARLLTLRGVGPWTVGHVALRALGDRDAVQLGDLHLPHLVSGFFTGEPYSDDARMEELLAPYAPYRARLIRYLELGGVERLRAAPR